jgi:hypothetical protein
VSGATLGSFFGVEVGLIEWEEISILSKSAISTVDTVLLRGSRRAELRYPAPNVRTDWVSIMFTGIGSILGALGGILLP